MGQVTRNRRNHSTLTPTGERSLKAQKPAMPKEIISEHGIVRTTNAANRMPKALLADEEFKKFRTNGTAIKRPYAKHVRHTTTVQKNSVESAFDSSQLIFIWISDCVCS